MNTENFGKKILSIRQNANLTQEELALRMGVTPQAISKWERGQGLPDISILSDLCRLLNVSSDLLLGLDYKNFTEDNDAKTQDVILRNLGICLDPAAIIFGVDLVQVFTDSPYAELMTAERMQMSKEGFWLPTVRIRDDLQLRPREFMVTIYDRVVYDEQVEVIDDTTLEHIIRTFGQEIRKKYGMLLRCNFAG